MANYFCEYCGRKYTSVSTLTSGNCQRHPSGANKGKHKLYEGGEKSQYICKYCGRKGTNISNLTAGKCQKHPDGYGKGRHLPTL